MERTFSTWGKQRILLPSGLACPLTHLRHDVLPGVGGRAGVGAGGGEDGGLDAGHEDLGRPQFVLSAALGPRVRHHGGLRWVRGGPGRPT